MSRLRSWLESIGLGAHAERFERDRIDFDVLPELTERSLTALERAARDVGSGTQPAIIR